MVMSLRCCIIRVLAIAALLTSSVEAQDSVATLPAGPAKALFVQRCAACHPLESVTDKRKSEDDWRASVSQMQSYGVALTPDEMDALVAYLAQNFGLTHRRK
jgi:mono/diheme cytochrome c family protein